MKIARHGTPKQLRNATVGNNSTELIYLRQKRTNQRNKFTRFDLKLTSSIAGVEFLNMNSYMLENRQGFAFLLSFRRAVNTYFTTFHLEGNFHQKDGIFT
jgi:hypothetical protein